MHIERDKGLYNDNMKILKRELSCYNRYIVHRNPNSVNCIVKNIHAIFLVFFKKILVMLSWLRFLVFLGHCFVMHNIIS